MTSQEQADNAATAESTFPWSSPVIPDWTRAAPGAVTPSGSPAVFRSSTHAWIAIRLVYLAEVARLRPAEVTATEQRYRDAYHQYVAFLETMRNVVAAAATDLDEAARIWNDVDQPEANRSITTMFCEQERAPGRAQLLATTAQKHFGFVSTCTVPLRYRDRPSRRADNRAAWDRSPDGRCASCGAPTISQSQHDHLRSEMRTNDGGRFRLKATYPTAKNGEVVLWSSRLVIATKGVADHVIPWSCGGRTSADNLVNVCAACNYSRNDASLDRVRVVDPSLGGDRL